MPSLINQRYIVSVCGIHPLLSPAVSTSTINEHLVHRVLLGMENLKQLNSREKETGK
jgi:hypothetical protein